jgi:DNA-binding MarR family transcriptional regulator
LVCHEALIVSEQKSPRLFEYRYNEKKTTTTKRSFLFHVPAPDPMTVDESIPELSWDNNEKVELHVQRRASASRSRSRRYTPYASKRSPVHRFQELASIAYEETLRCMRLPDKKRCVVVRGTPISRTLLANMENLEFVHEFGSYLIGKHAALRKKGIERLTPEQRDEYEQVHGLVLLFEEMRRTMRAAVESRSALLIKRDETTTALGLLQVRKASATTEKDRVEIDDQIAVLKQKLHHIESDIAANTVDSNHTFRAIAAKHAGLMLWIPILAIVGFTILPETTKLTNAIQPIVDTVAGVIRLQTKVGAACSVLGAVGVGALAVCNPGTAIMGTVLPVMATLVKAGSFMMTFGRGA